MTDPLIPPIVKRLLALDTPVARRILELALFGLLMWGCAWCMESATVPKGLKIIATFIFVPGLFVAFAMLIGIAVTVLKSIDGPTEKTK